MWVLIIASLALGLGLARLMVQFNVNEILKNWKDYRCQVQVLMNGNLFKPPSDPRTDAEFAFDNFNFCTSEIAKSALTTILKPIFDVFYTMVQAAIQSIGFTMNLRSLAANLFHGLNSIFDIFFKRFNLTIHELRKTFVLQMDAMGKANGIAMGAIYSGISIIRTIKNFFELMMTIAIAILVILVVMVIFLFFILAPFTPLIMTTIGIVAAGGMAGAVGGMASAFGCFAPATNIILQDGSYKQIRSIAIGDVLNNGSVVTALMKFTNDEHLYIFNGINVTGSHIVYIDGLPVFIKDTKSPKNPHVYETVYCLNTTNHKIPVQGASGQVLFADWEELDSEDMVEWDALVRRSLGASPAPSAAALCESEGGFYPDCTVGTMDGVRAIERVQIDDLIQDGESYTRVVGVVKISGEEVKSFGPLGSGANWILHDERWIRAAESLTWQEGTPAPYLIALFTLSGTYTVNGTLVRDFSDIGLSNIEGSYNFTQSRLLQKCSV